jgi:PhnB protein
MLSVRNGTKAIEFYKSAFGAGELFRVDDESGAVVARLSVGTAEFWVADESPEHANFSPESLGGGSVRMVMTVEDPDVAFDRAVAAGATVVLARRRPVWLALRTNRRSVRPPLGNRQALINIASLLSARSTRRRRSSTAG